MFQGICWNNLSIWEDIQSSAQFVFIRLNSLPYQSISLQPFPVGTTLLHPIFFPLTTVLCRVWKSTSCTRILRSMQSTSLVSFDVQCTIGRCIRICHMCLFISSRLYISHTSLCRHIFNVSTICLMHLFSNKRPWVTLFTVNFVLAMSCSIKTIQ